MESLITRAEKEAHERPRRYQLKVIMLALLGYLVIFGMLFALLSLSIGIGWAALTSTTFAILLLNCSALIIDLVTFRTSLCTLRA